jgi:choline dehydrogenase
MENQVFDYIVVGAGSAGSVLANRLSANPKHKVLVLEAGRESHPWSRIPVGFARLIENPAANWLYSSEPDEGTGQRRIPIPRGKLLGGSSSINGMVFVRGQSQDYDTGRNSAIAAGVTARCCRFSARWKATRVTATRNIAAAAAR